MLSFFLLLLSLSTYLTKAKILNDEILECELKFDKYDQSASYQRNFMADRRTKWPNNEVPYEISTDFKEDEIELIKEAMQHIMDNSCLKWVERKDEQNYVHIHTEKPGCFANLGFNPHRGKHELNLQQASYRANCMVKGIAVHEMLHILGFAHEQTRPDRSNYVQILWDNIDPKAYFNFFRAADKDESPLPEVCDQNGDLTTFDDCYAGFKTDTLGHPYDFGSIMHYRLQSFSINQQNVMETLSPVSPEITIGQRVAMTSTDIEKLLSAYKCKEPIKSTTKGGSSCIDIADNCEEIIENSLCRFPIIVPLCKRSCNAC